MKKHILFVLCITGIACLFMTAQPANATIYDQFQEVKTRNWNWKWVGEAENSDFKLPDSLRRHFVTLKDGFNSTDNDFCLYPNPNRNPDRDLDDGYAKIPLGFKYRYNGVEYDSVYVSINGFITFDVPPGNVEITKDREGLFIYNNSIPNNVVAPYWGDHKYWPNTTQNVQAGREPSSIGFVHYTYKHYFENGDSITKNVCLIQWENLNINYQKTEFGSAPHYFLGNVASFQLIIYEGPDEVKEQQGDMEFRYGNYGPTETQKQWIGNLAEYNPNNEASVGYKGSTNTAAHLADFVNAFYNGYDAVNQPADVFMQRNYTTPARRWPASGDVGRAIWLRANYSIDGDDSWGDGDADMSKTDGERHQGQTSTGKFTTVNDVREIMMSVVTGEPLDSAYKRAAFHADVNHDGRYYYFNSRNAGIYRMTKSGEIILDNSVIGATGPGSVDPTDVSRDTFFLRKVGTLSGIFGFSEHYGINADKIQIDFIDLGLTGINASNSIKILRIVDPHNNTGLQVKELFDYQIRICVEATSATERQAIRNLLWESSENRVNNEINKIRLKLKKNIVWRSNLIYEDISNLPGLTSPIETKIFWEANELDASLILAYLGGQIGKLPWVWENPNHNNKGKVVTPWRYADNIAFDNAKYVGDNIVVPVYFNGIAETNQSIKFKYNADILNLESANANVMATYSNDTKTAVIISDGYFNPNIPVAYITLNNTVRTFDATNVRFYGENAENVSYKFTNNASTNNDVLGQNTPNPVINFTEIKINIPENGNYKLVISDNSGNIVKVIANGTFNAGEVSFNWDTTNENGDKVFNGTYFYTLEGDNTYITKSLVIAR